MGGISATTVNDLMLAAGAYVMVGTVDMGALSGTIHYWVERELYHPDLYGTKGEIKATGHTIKAVPKITFSMTEMEYLKFQEIWHSIGASSDANSEKIGAGTVGALNATDDYKQIEVLGAEMHDGHDVKIHIDQAYVSNNPDMTLSDREDTFIEVELTGVYLATTPTTFPAYVALAKA